LPRFPLATAVSQTRPVRRLLPFLFPSKHNSCSGFPGYAPTVAIPYSQQFRGSAIVAGEYSCIQIQTANQMSAPEQKKKVVVDNTTVAAECRAELIFYARDSSGAARPVDILGEYACDFRRPDWEHRWSEWNSRQNPYLHLFLCAKHARALGLIRK
jgi:hypothetical protein